MRIHPYQTTICKNYQTNKLETSLRRANIESPFTNLTTATGNTVIGAKVVTPNSDYDPVNGFTQPIELDGNWILDARPYMRSDKREGSYRLVNENDYTFQCVRLALTQVADSRGSLAFFRLSELPARVFVRWITLALAQRYQLSLEQQIQVSVIAGYYYYTQLADGLKLSVDEVQIRSQVVGRVASVPPSNTLRIGEQLGSLTDANDLAVAISEHCDSVRVKNLKFTDLFTLLASSWVGVNSRENVGVALEHIPTWIAMIYSAVDERSFRKTILTQRVEQASRQQEQQQFLQATYRLITTRFN